MHISGQSAGNIAVMMCVTRNTVYLTIKSMEAELNGKDAEDVSTDSEPDQPSVADHVQERREQIDELMLEKKEDGNFAMKTARDVRKRIRETSGELISLRTIQRDLRALNHIWKRMPIVPCMTAKHITRRMDLGPALLELNANDILFSDESYFDTCDTHRGAYQRDGHAQQTRQKERCHAQQTRPKERYVTKVMVWGVIGVGYATLVIMNSGTVNATQYVETLKEYLVPKIDTARHIFMQDGASAHTAKFTQEFLKEQNIRTVEWPAKSCDLNPIENLWSIMKRKIDVDIMCDVNELERAIRKSWSEITQDEIDNLVLSFPHRIQKMLDNEGRPCQLKRCYLAREEVQENEV
ncbi:unnamed protein product [Bodo saltans]|uniref:Tc1-like transposase DDE domain-containing protein n=1 Tax=Bodo saltans TaxID=75058 RepID=A0A0S4J5G9_BODSA|nr:unnamed protein product [Bodo saltans]|eukprot:CUG86683.1 unnamed protein product [Bodo saltans]